MHYILNTKTTHQTYENIQNRECTVAQRWHVYAFVYLVGTT